MRETKNRLLWGVRGLGFFKKEIFCLCFVCFVYVYSEENKKVAIMGAKEDSEPIWGKIFFCLGEYVKRLDLTK
jgi:hypothetical protein